MQEYLDSSKWKTREKGDFMLYNAVNDALDLTIERLGRSRVEEGVDNLKQLIYIGSKKGKQLEGINGCGIPNLHVSEQPFADINELPWFTDLSPEEKAIVLDLRTD